MGDRGNWGRWGDNDQRGTLNLITPELIVSAAGLVKSGRIYVLAIPLSEETPVHPVRQPPQHYVKFHGMSGTGRGAAEDVLVVNTHSGTHIDPLSHTWVDGLMYNGESAEQVTPKGVTVLSVDKIGAIWTRGALLDVPVYRGVELLEAGELVTPPDLQGCCQSEGVTLQPGDAVLVRTGWYQMSQRDRYRHDHARPGLSSESVDWLIEQDVAVLGVDTFTADPTPPDPATPQGSVHQRFLHKHGGYLIESMDLEEIARDAVYRFLFVVAPLRIKNGLGSPITPLAVT